jgi:hypothetical protein
VGEKISLAGSIMLILFLAVAFGREISASNRKEAEEKE